MNFKKTIIAIFLASFIGIMANPEMLAASNSVAVNGINNDGIVKTIIKKPKIEVHVDAKPQTVVNNDYMTSWVEPAQTVEVARAEAPAYVAPTYVEPVTPANNIQIAGRTLEIVDVSSTSVDSYDHVNKYGQNFYWGHNSNEVFRGLYNLGAGSTFTMTYDGKTTKYRVADVVIFEKNFGNNMLQLDGSGNYMMSLVNGRFKGAKYDAVLMTCYGTSVGNGDATNRYVLLANAI